MDLWTCRVNDHHAEVSDWLLPPRAHMRKDLSDSVERMNVSDCFNYLIKDSVSSISIPNAESHSALIKGDSDACLAGCDDDFASLFAPPLFRKMRTCAIKFDRENFEFGHCQGNGPKIVYNTRKIKFRM